MASCLLDALRARSWQNEVLVRLLNLKTGFINEISQTSTALSRQSDVEICKWDVSIMSEATYDRPLIVKDFMKERRRKVTVKRSKFFEKVEKLPDSKMFKGQSKYLEMVNAIAKEKKGTYRVLLDAIKKDLTAKSAYSSVEKVLVQVARRNGVDFNTALRRQVQTKKGVRIHASYPEYARWKDENMRLRIVDNQLFIEKKTDKPL